MPRVPLPALNPKAAALDLNAEDAVVGDDEQKVNLPRPPLRHGVAGRMDDYPAVGRRVGAQQIEHALLGGGRA